MTGRNFPADRGIHRSAGIINRCGAARRGAREFAELINAPKILLYFGRNWVEVGPGDKSNDSHRMYAN